MVLVQPPPGHEAKPPGSATPPNSTMDRAGASSSTPPDIALDKADDSSTPAPIAPLPPPDSSRPPRKFQFKQTFATSAGEATPAAPPKPSGPQPVNCGEPDVVAALPLEPPPEPSESDDADLRDRSWMQVVLVSAAAVFGITLALLIVVLAASQWKTEPEEPSPQKISAADGKSDPSRVTAGQKVESDSTPAPDVAPPSADAPPEEPKSVVDTQATPPGDTDADAPQGAADALQPESPADGTAVDSKAAAIMDPPPDEPTVTAKSPTEEAVPDSVPPSTPPESPSPKMEPGETPADADSPLNLTVAGAEFNGVALWDFLQFFAEFTTVPITLDFDSMRRAEIPHDVRVNLQLDATSAGQLLQSALEPAGLKFILANGQVFITPIADVNGEVQTRSYDVSDLAETPEQLAPLAALITATIEPTSWQDAGGLGALTVNEQSLNVEQTLAVHFEMARLLDRLRSARGLLPRSELPRELLTCVPIFAPLEEKFQKRLTLNFGDATNIMTILERLRNETEIRLLVDWESTGAVGWKPDATSTLSANDAAFSQLLDTWLAPQQLGFRVVGDLLIQIASLAALKTHGEVEVYRLTENAAKTGDSIVQGWVQELGEPTIAEASGVAVFEPVSRCLVVRLPQPLQRQTHRWLTSQGHLDAAK
jgi:hypothetical protein